MGVVNVTPDSFSDGGRFFDPDAAVAHGLALFDEGADVVDVGGESTRPGFTEVDPVEEARRVLPVVAELAKRGRVSIDTRHRDVAEAAVEAGATIVNDVSATLWPVAAAAGVAWVAGHCPGVPGAAAPALAAGVDVVAQIRAFLRDVAARALEGGVDEVWVDPGIGFGKDAAQSLGVIARIDELVADGTPVLLGASRKSFIGRLLWASDAGASAPPLPGMARRLVGWDHAEQVPTDDRIEGSLAVATWAAMMGVGMVRVHDVRHTVHAVTLVGDPARGAEIGGRA